MGDHRDGDADIRLGRPGPYCRRSGGDKLPGGEGGSTGERGHHRAFEPVAEAFALARNPATSGPSKTG